MVVVGLSTIKLGDKGTSFTMKELLALPTVINEASFTYLGQAL